MTLDVTPHLNFRAQARAALDFYRDVFGGEQTIATYADMGQGEGAERDLVIWGQVAAPDGFRIMAFDILEPRPFAPGANAFFISLRGSSVAEVAARWQGLSEGAEILHPLGPAPWSAAYGMLKDRFGITWVVDAAPGAG